MKSNIKKLRYEDLSDFWEVVKLAGSESYYPEYKDAQVKWYKKLMDECDDFTYFGAFQNEKLVGGMAIGDFVLNLRSSIIQLSGVGMVHTDMLHKKEKVCKDMIQYFINSNRKKGINMLFLSPFKPDFYRKMGFGYGNLLHHYRITPKGFPNSGDKGKLAYADDQDKLEFLHCFNRIFQKTHGFIDRNPFGLTETFGSGRRVVVYKNAGKIQGALVFTFGTKKELIIEEMFYENNDALMAISSFLNSQSDQIDRILFSTPDEYFYYILKDSLNGLYELEISTATVDNMFRVIDVAGLFKDIVDTNFNNQNAVLNISITDTFCLENNATTTVEFVNGQAKVLESQRHHEKLKIHLDISDFSSLIMGSINARALWRLGLLNISDVDQLDLVDQIFAFSQKPLCTVHI